MRRCSQVRCTSAKRHGTRRCCASAERHCTHRQWRRHKIRGGSCRRMRSLRLQHTCRGGRTCRWWHLPGCTGLAGCGRGGARRQQDSWMPRSPSSGWADSSMHQDRPSARWYRRAAERGCMPAACPAGSPFLSGCAACEVGVLACRGDLAALACKGRKNEGVCEQWAPQ